MFCLQAYKNDLIFILKKASCHNSPLFLGKTLQANLARSGGTHLIPCTMKHIVQLSKIVELADDKAIDRILNGLMIFFHFFRAKVFLAAGVAGDFKSNKKTSAFDISRGFTKY